MSPPEYEPVPGLNPEERILWQGRPSRTYLARYVFRARWVGIYLGAMVLLSGFFAANGGAGATGTVMAMLAVLPLALVGWGILELFAWAHARTTLYTLTERRWVLQFGVALDMTVNLPFKGIVNASFKTRRGGLGDVAIELGGAFRTPSGEIMIEGPSYFHLWPHARPGHLTMPQPSLRGVAEVAEVARIFAEALDRFRSEETSPAPASSASAEAPAPRNPAPGLSPVGVG